jgi:hypothetical protein
MRGTPNTIVQPMIAQETERQRDRETVNCAKRRDGETALKSLGWRAQIRLCRRDGGGGATGRTPSLRLQWPLAGPTSRGQASSAPASASVSAPASASASPRAHRHALFDDLGIDFHPRPDNHPDRICRGSGPAGASTHAPIAELALPPPPALPALAPAPLSPSPSLLRPRPRLRLRWGTPKMRTPWAGTGPCCRASMDLVHPYSMSRMLIR